MQILSAFRMVDSRCAITTVVRLRNPDMSPSSAACTSFSDSLSSAEVASSRSKIAGSPMIARAIAMRCFCPPETNDPPTPTSLSYPLSIRDTNSCALATRAASTTSARVAGAPRVLPAAMLSCTVPENSVGSCSTSPIFERSHSGSKARTSTPSSDTTPASFSKSRGGDPAEVGTTATDCRSASPEDVSDGEGLLATPPRSRSSRALSASGVTGS